MKKTFIALFILFLLSSCWTNTDQFTNKDLINENINTLIEDEIIEEGKLINDNSGELLNVDNDKFLEISKEALDNLDINICNQINIIDYKNTCISDIVNKKIEFKIIDIVFCESIQNLYIKNICIDSFYNISAENSWDIKLCNNITDNLTKNSCKNNIFNSNKSELVDIKYCDIFDEEMQKSNCINEIIKNTTSDTMVTKSCDKFTDIIQINSCKNDVIIRNAKQWINKCSLSSDLMIKNQCINEYNISKWIKEKTLSYCNSESSDIMQISTCENKVIEELNKNESTKKYCDLLDTKMKIESCKSSYNTNLNSFEIVNPKDFCDNLMNNNDWTMVDKNLCYKLTWVN